MKTVNTLEEVKELVNNGNYYYNGNEFENYTALEKAAKNFFLEITADNENQKEYYKHFGLELGEVRTERVKIEQYYVEDINCTVTVEFYEAYVDSGVSNEDYFHGYFLRY